MDSRAVGRVALISIHPEYAEAILAGEKRVEFRKKPIAQDVTHVILYATKPIGAVIGAFSVDGQQTGSPDRLWERFSAVSGIDREKFESYFNSHSTGTGILIRDVYRSCKHLTLESAVGIKRAPQSFQYLDRDRALSLLEQIEVNAASKFGGLARDYLRVNQLELQSIND